MVIAIDGPAGSGKSTVAKKVARELGIAYFDSGALYRAYTLEFLNRGLDPNKDDISKSLDEIGVEVQESVDGRKILLNGKDVTEAVRAQKVTAFVSVVAENGLVRDRVNEILRKTARQQSIVVDGRDIGTAVFPDAELKFYLDATIEERARRRYLQQRSTNDELDLEVIKQDIRRRDQHDSERAIAPLCQAPDAIVVDTTDLTIAQVTEIITERARATNF